MLTQMSHSQGWALATVTMLHDVGSDLALASISLSTPG
jgi:hypothetical protein